MQSVWDQISEKGCQTAYAYEKLGTCVDGFCACTRCLGQSGALAWAEVPHGVSRGVSQGYAAQRRRLQEGMSPALLSSYPGQEAYSAVSNSNSASSVPGNPQPLFPPPPGPPRTSADVAGSQRLEFSPNAEVSSPEETPLCSLGSAQD